MFEVPPCDHSCNSTALQERIDDISTWLLVPVVLQEYFVVFRGRIVVDLWGLKLFSLVLEYFLQLNNWSQFTSHLTKQSCASLISFDYDMPGHSESWYMCNCIVSLVRYQVLQSYSTKTKWKTFVIHERCAVLLPSTRYNRTDDFAFLEVSGVFIRLIKRTRGSSSQCRHTTQNVDQRAESTQNAKLNI